MEDTARRALLLSATDATERTPIQVWLQTGRTHGQVPIGTIYHPAGLAAVLRSAAADLEAAHTTEPASQSPAPQ